MSRRDDYIPANDLQFSSWLGRFSDGLAMKHEELGLTPEEIAFAAEADAEMAEALAQLAEARRVMNAAMARKANLRKSIESRVRPFVRHIQEEPTMTQEIRSLLGLSHRDGGQTRYEVQQDVPLLHLAPGSGQVEVHFGDNPGNERLNKRPKWTRACQIYRKKDGESEYHLVACATKSPFIDRIVGDMVRVSYVAAYEARGTGHMGAESAAHTVVVGRYEGPPAEKSLSKAA